MFSACCTVSRPLCASAGGQASRLRKPPSQRPSPPGGQAVCALLGADLSAGGGRRPRSQCSPPASLCFPRHSQLEKGQGALAAAPPGGRPSTAAGAQRWPRGSIPQTHRPVLSPQDATVSGDLSPAARSGAAVARFRPAPLAPATTPVCQGVFVFRAAEEGVFCLQCHGSAIKRGPQWELYNIGAEGCNRSGRHLREPSRAMEMF